MKVTMLYFNTIAKIIKEHGYTWEHVEKIEDNNQRVKYGENNQFSCSLGHMFYCTHMGGFNLNRDNDKKLIAAFLQALKEV